jgi:hypothetical protein
MTIGGEIVDGEIDARSPLTARLMRKLRGNLKGNGFRLVWSLAHSGNTELGSWTTVETTWFYIPDCCVGDSGTTLTFADCSTHTAGPGGDAEIPRGSHYRLKIGTDYSDTYTQRGTGTTIRDFEITWTPTGDAAVTVEIQAYVENTSAPNQAQFSWGLGNYGLIEAVYA